MCDCYVMGCSVCGLGVPIHISNYAIHRSVIKNVFCGNHIPEFKGSIIFFNDVEDKNFKTDYAIEIDIDEFKRVVHELNKEHIATLLTTEVISPNSAKEYVPDFPYYEDSEGKTIEEI